MATKEQLLAAGSASDHYANKETLARHNGEPLLGTEGMEAIEGLLEAHISYDQAETLHKEEIAALQDQIDALTAQRDSLLTDRQTHVSAQGQARETGAYGVKKTVRASKGNNPVYAATLRAATSDPNSSLWYPQNLEAADSLGRTFVSLDEALRSSRKVQPVLVVEAEKGNYWANVFVSKTKRLGGLEPTTVPIKEAYVGGLDIVTQRDALALPVNSKYSDAFQISAQSFGREESLDAYRRKPSEHSTIKDGFKLALPTGKFTEVPMTGSYDEQGSIVEIEGNLGWESGKIVVAVGNLSVASALDTLQAHFVEISSDPKRQEPLFRQLAERLLGKDRVRVIPVAESK